MGKSWDIAAYAYKAEQFTPVGLIEELVREGTRSPGAYGMNAESVLDQWAGEEGIDRGDEYSFDSDSFPKVIFESQFEDGDIFHNGYVNGSSVYTTLD